MGLAFNYTWMVDLYWVNVGILSGGPLETSHLNLKMFGFLQLELTPDYDE